MQYEYTKRLLEVVERKLVSGKECFRTCFAKVSTLCCNKLSMSSMFVTEQWRTRPTGRSIDEFLSTESPFRFSFGSQRQETT